MAIPPAFPWELTRKIPPRRQKFIAEWGFPITNPTRLPRTQRTEPGWCKHLVDVATDASYDERGHLRFVLSPGVTPAVQLLVERRLAPLPAEVARGA